MFERVIIRTINSDGWPIDFELKEGQSPKPAIDWLTNHGYQPAPGAAITVSNAPPATRQSPARPMRKRPFTPLPPNP